MRRLRLGSQEALLNATSHDQAVNFDLMLASRAAAQARQDARAGGWAGADSADSGIRQLVGNGAQSLSLTSSLSADTEAQQGTGAASGAALPSVREAPISRAIGSHQRADGRGEPAGRGRMDRLRDALETYRVANGRASSLVGGGLFGRRRRLWVGGLAVDLWWGAGRVAAAGGETFAASIRDSRMGRFSGWAAIRR